MKHRVVRVAVVGTGHLGRHHARILAGVENAKLVGIVDSQETVAKEVADVYKVP